MRLQPATKDSSPALEERTIDAFHRGDFYLIQPRRGHRAGTDAMMLAAAVPSSFSGRLVDLGAGAGAAGLAVASRCRNSRVVLVEREAETANCARDTLAYPENSRIAGRGAVIETDVTQTGKARIAAGLEDSSFDFAIMNPPFNLRTDRPSPDDLRRGAHVMDDGLFESWLRTAAAIVRPKGGFALIARPRSLTEILAAMDGRFGAAQIVPILPRADEPAIRIVIRAIRASRAPLSLMPPLIIHDAAGDHFSIRADNVNNGRASLFGD